MKFRFVGVFLLALLSYCASAAEGNQPWEEYDKLIKNKGSVGALGPTLLGDQVSYYTGGLSFSTTDVSLPGNNALPVAITRTFTVGTRNKEQGDSPFADWDLDIPRMEGVFAGLWVSGASGTPNTRCSITTVGAARPPFFQKTAHVPIKTYFPEDYWHGVQLHLPSGGGELLLANGTTTKPSSGGPYYWLTSDFTYLSCLPTLKNAPGLGEGFLAITPDGTKYWFDWLAQYYEPQLKDGSGTDLNDLARRRNVLYATRVEDRFGNWVQYAYTNAYTAPALLSTITSSDGRQINVTYEAYGHIATVNDNNSHTWTYQYQYANALKGSLTAVIQPDASRWTIDFAAFTTTPIFYERGTQTEPARSCTDPGTVLSSGAVGTITHPSGTSGTFTVMPTRFTRSGVPVACDSSGTPNYAGDDVAYYAMAWDSFALTRKLVTGVGLAPAAWNYVYNGSTVEVTAPNSDFTRYTFGNGYRTNEGKLLKVERGTSPTDIRKTDVMTYELTLTGQPFPTPIGTGAQPRGDGFTSEYLRPQKVTTTTQDGASFSSTVTSFDSFARPLAVTKASTGMAVNYSKTEATVYYNDWSKWVLGQVQSTAINGTSVSATTFDPATALPLTRSSFGKLQQTLTYILTAGSDQAGTLATVKDGNNNITTLSNWKRGTPQLVTYPPTTDQPSGVSKSAIVDNNGWITATTDENGYSTGYGYDVMGRLASIVYPTADSTLWNTTTQTFAPVTSAEYGVPAGHWKQTISTGNARKVTYFDALWRPLVTESYDNADAANTRSLNVTRYDVSGHPAYASYPLRTLADYAVPTLGTRTTYDALDRPVRVDQDSEGGAVLSATTEYLPGFQIRSTNPRGQATTTGYMAYDQPSTDWPVALTHPAGAYTDIVRNAFGAPTQLTRRDATSSVSSTRRYLYDNAQQLCKAIEPETGTSVSTFDAAGNLDWTASGQSLNTSDCTDVTSVPASARVTRTYDARNRLKTLRFLDQQGNQDWSYTPDSLPASVFTLNKVGASNPTNLYAYNKRRLLTTEVLALPAWYTWSIGYTYDANASLQKLTYPSGNNVDYAPNALGQPTQARDVSTGGATYASNLAYYPNGALQQFTYGNGLTHTMTQSAVRQLPARSTDGVGVLDFGYGFDANANVTAITDYVSGRQNRAMSYDGLDRLLTTTSPMLGSGATYTYDVLDNLTRVTTGGTAARDHYYCYDGKWQLTNVKTGGCKGISVIGLGYDVRGNLQNKNGQLYDFDSGNRLREVMGVERYRYDAYGRRILSMNFTSGTILSQYSQSGQLLYQASDRTANATDHIYLAGSLLAQREVANVGGAVTVKYQHTDALGSPVAVTSSTGAVLERMEYEPFGKRMTGGPGTMTPKDGPGYTGHVLDAATGLNYMQQRYYDPGIGRFLSVDPVTADGNTGGNFNRYWYAADNPYRFTDPDGRTEVNPVVQWLAPEGTFARAAGEAIGALAAYGKGLATGDTALQSAAVDGMRENVTASDGVNAAMMGVSPRGAAGEGEMGAAGKGRAANRLAPDPNATGAHSTLKRDASGNTTNTATYTPNSKNPSGFQETKRVDVTGKAHTNPNGAVVNTPHVKEAGVKDVRPALPEELPKR